MLGVLPPRLQPLIQDLLRRIDLFLRVVELFLKYPVLLINRKFLLKCGQQRLQQLTEDLQVLDGDEISLLD